GHPPPINLERRPSSGRALGDFHVTSRRGNPGPSPRPRPSNLGTWFRRLVVTASLRRGRPLSLIDWTDWLLRILTSRLNKLRWSWDGVGQKPKSIFIYRLV